jgi:hypothetical protein
MHKLISNPVCKTEEPFHAVMNFRLPSRGHVLIQGIFAPHLGKVAPLKDGQRYFTRILRTDLDYFYS